MNKKEEAWRKVSDWEEKIEQKDFYKWVDRKAASLWKRDKAKLQARGEGGSFNDNKKRSEYQDAVCTAILAMSANECPCTGKKLSWAQIGTWKNEVAKSEGKEFKKKFALLPTVDHRNSAPEADFVICSREANDAKNDLPLESFITLCENVLKHNGYKVSKE